MGKRFEEYVNAVVDAGKHSEYESMDIEALVLLYKEQRESSEDLAQHLMASFAPEMAKAVCRQSGYDDDLIDRFASACIKLLEVLKTYDSQKGGVRAFVYVSLLGHDDEDDGRDVSKGKKGDVSEVRKFISAYEMMNGKMPSREEIKAKTGFGDLRLSTTLDLIYTQTIYLDQKTDDGEGDNLVAQIANPFEDDPQNLFSNRSLKKDLHKVMSDLDEGDKRIFMDSVVHRKSQVTIAKECGMSQRWVSKRIEMIRKSLCDSLMKKGWTSSYA